jgi:uncharacterized protein
MLVEAEIWTVARTEQGHAVLVRPIGGEVAVPIFIGQLEAQSILIGLGNVPMLRPLTHDLFLSVLSNLEVAIRRVEIVDLKDETFYARLILVKDSQEIVIDSRPSDSMAIAVRQKCPIFIADNVVDEAGIAISAIKDENEINEEDLSQGAEESEKARLEKELQKCVVEENYEEAARIRDRLMELEAEHDPSDEE